MCLCVRMYVCVHVFVLFVCVYVWCVCVYVCVVCMCVVCVYVYVCVYVLCICMCISGGSRLLERGFQDSVTFILATQQAVVTTVCVCCV